MHKLKVLVIGGNGFLGKNIVSELKDNDCDVSVYDMKTNPNCQCRQFEGDIINDAKFSQIIRGNDVLVYLVSAIMPAKSMQEPLSSYTVDIPLLIHTLESCRTENVRRIVYASSGGTIYGDNEIPNKEDAQLMPINNYAICKLTCEKILLMYNKIYGMDNIILRIVNPFGKWQKMVSGVGAITSFCMLMLQKKEINIFGDGNIVRDYVSVEDVARAFLLASSWNNEEAIIPVFNIGSGCGHSLNEIISILEKILGYQASVKYLQSRLFDVKCNVLDISKANKYLKYNVKQKIEDSIKEYVYWLKKMEC